MLQIKLNIKDVESSIDFDRLYDGDHNKIDKSW